MLSVARCVQYLDDETNEFLNATVDHNRQSPRLAAQCGPLFVVAWHPHPLFVAEHCIYAQYQTGQKFARRIGIGNRKQS